MDRLDSMRVFATVVETGSFSDAARRLGMSKALASKHVARLEQHFSARLLNRTTRQVALTEIGQACYDRCRDLLSRFDELETAVQAQHSQPTGQLRISGPRVFGEDVLVPCVRTFCTRYREMRIDLVLEERLVDIVGEGFDLAVRIGPMADSTLIARKVAEYRYVMCASPAYLAHAGTPEEPEDLAGHDCIVNTSLAQSDHWQFLRDGKTFSLRVPGRIRINSDRPVRDFVLAGQGVGLCLLPTVREDIEAGRLVRLLTHVEAYDRSVSVVYPHARHLSAKVRAFIDHMVEYCRDF